MYTTSHHYSDDVRDTELDEDYVVAPYVCAIGPDWPPFDYI
jgi:hypothetical protein